MESAKKESCNEMGVIEHREWASCMKERVIVSTCELGKEYQDTLDKMKKLAGYCREENLVKQEREILECKEKLNKINEKLVSKCFLYY